MKYLQIAGQRAVRLVRNKKERGMKIIPLSYGPIPILVIYQF